MGLRVMGLGAYNYNLANYLSSLLVPLLPDNYSVKDQAKTVAGFCIKYPSSFTPNINVSISLFILLLFFVLLPNS